MNYATILAQVEVDLRRCRRQIAKRLFLARIHDSLDILGFTLPGIGGASVLLRTATGSVPELNYVFMATGISVILLLVWAGWRTIVAKPVDFGNAAERLDLSQSTHNRIATAIALLRAGDQSEFAKAAIQDGLECLAQLREERPFIEQPLRARTRTISLSIAGVALIVIAGFIKHEPVQASGDSVGAGVGEGSTALLTSPSTGYQSESKKPTLKEEKEKVADSSTAGGESKAETEPDLPKLDTDTPSDGSVGQHSSNSANRSQTASNSRNTGGATSGAGAKKNPKAKGAMKRKRSSSSKPAVKKPEGQKSQKGGSMNARGSSGGSAMKTSESDWSSKVQASPGDQDDSDAEDEPDEEADGEKQRLGMQPGLKNRTSRISRELSLAMGKGQDDSTVKGRGGPSAQKKSRGTSTMILGVPVPGFVRGRLMPGSTKSTQEEAEPSSRKGEYSTTPSIKSAVPQEAQQERYRPSADDSAQASQYLINLHKKAENKARKEKGSDTNE